MQNTVYSFHSVAHNIIAGRQLSSSIQNWGVIASHYLILLNNSPQNTYTDTDAILSGTISRFPSSFLNSISAAS